MITLICQLVVLRKLIYLCFSSLQIKMLESSKELANEHTFGSRPSWWPLMRRGVAFWIARDNNVRFTALRFPSPQFHQTVI